MISFAVFAAVAMLASTSAYGNSPSMADAQRAFFNARYEAAADLALALQARTRRGLEPLKCARRRCTSS